jgi:hypothetical protein
MRNSLYVWKAENAKEMLWILSNLMDRGEYYKIAIRRRWSGSTLLRKN